jgi:inhibitor of cysteine peptidase
MFTKLQILLLMTLVAISVMTAGCTPGLTSLTEAEDGKRIELNSGARLVITLEGNPTTGYTWEVMDLDASLFRQVGEIEFKSSNPGALGAGGTQTLTLEALKPGSATLTLVYHRPWETDVPPLHTFSITVTVK